VSFPRYPSYKSSGVEWLGDVPAHWELTFGRRLFSQKREPGLPTDDQLSATQKYGVVPQKLFMELEDQKVALALSGLENFKHVEVGDFVISLRSFQGGIERSEYSGCVSPAYTVLRPDDRVVGRFWGYFLKSKGYIEALQTMTDGIRDGKNISYQQFGQIGVPVASLAEQTRIAEFLDRETAKIDELVAEQRRLMELLKEKRQAVISHAVTRGLNPKAPLKPSGIEWLGDVPRHWGIISLKHLVSAPIIDGPHETPTAIPVGIPFVSAEAVSKGFIDFEKIWGYISPNEHERFSKRYKPQRGDILLVKLGATAGTPAIVETDADFNVWVPLAAIRPKNDMEPRFVFHVLRSDNLQRAFQLNWTYGTQQTLGLRTIENLRVPVPPSDEQKRIVRYIDSIFPAFDTLTAEAQRAIDLLQERRTALISAAVTGQIDIRGLAASSSLEGLLHAAEAPASYGR
jgi:type I restriction enzyme S subunit